jgi:hypothetical protein
MLMEQCLAVYEDKGNWKDDKRHGKGGMKYADGAVYEGYWKDEKWHGWGKVNSDGAVYEGSWKCGKSKSKSKRHTY